MAKAVPITIWMKVLWENDCPSGKNLLEMRLICGIPLKEDKTLVIEICNIYGI